MREMRYLVRAPNKESFDSILEYLRREKIEIFQELGRRLTVSTGDLPEQTIVSLRQRDFDVAVEDRYEPER